MVEKQLAHAGTSWSMGVFGALAEFHREADEPFSRDGASLATARGAIRLEALAGCRVVPYEWRNARQHERVPGVALCLPEAAAKVASHRTLTELGPDREAVRAEDREAILFDLGLPTDYARFCVRTSDESLLALLRAAAGTPVLNAPIFGELAMRSPHRVVLSRLGRIEVFQPIGREGGTTPEGPHTHLLPKLLKAGRTHSANALLPAGLVPCATYYEEAA